MINKNGNNIFRPSEESLTERAIQIVHQLRKSTVGMTKPMVFSINEEFGQKPFLILISCLLSLRARDTVTLPICKQLFTRATTPQQLLAIPISELESLLYPLGFYKKKSQLLHDVSSYLIKHFNSEVPATLEELLSIKGVGRKTANLVLGEGFGIPALCVDTHVHRISNRLGLVQTKTPYETELALQKILPPQYWIEYNTLLVMWGQNICVPISPLCSQCAIYSLCERVGVKKHR